MVDVVLEEIKWIPGVPEEMTGQAVKAGIVAENKVVGVTVFLPEKPGEKIYIELALKNREQASLLHRHSILPIEQTGTCYRLLPYWKKYLSLKYNACGGNYAQGKPETSATKSTASPPPCGFRPNPSP